MKKLMVLLLTLCMVLSMLPVTARAATEDDSGTCGENLTWTLSGDGVLTISGSGKMEDYLGYSANRPPWYGSIDSIKTCILETGVESIGDFALAFARKLQSVSIPNTVTSIGYSAFYYCNSLPNIVIPSSVEEMHGQIFKGCSCLGSAGPIGGGYDIEFGWKEMIPNYAFSSCTSLQSIYIPDSIYTIGDGAFNGCSNLTSVIVPNTVTSIGNSAFYGCESLSDFTIPDKVTYIGSDAFCRCASLKSITIPDGITGIESRTFSYNPALIDVTIPDCVTYIGSSAFAECTGLTTVSVGSGVTSIHFGAFSGCSKLRDIYFTGSAPDFEPASAYADGVFASVTATVYYPGDNPTWTTDVMQNYGGTITWVPYYQVAEISASLQDYSGDDLILIYPLELGSAWNLTKTLSDVTISSSLGEEVSPEGGYFIHRADASARDMVLRKDGYRDYILPAEVSRTMIGKENTAYSLSAYMQKDTKDGKPYISTVFGRVSGSGKPYTDLRVTALAVKEDAASDIIISAVGFGDQEVTYVIAQDTLRKTSNTTGVFSAAKLFDLFDDTGTVYAYAVGSDGSRTEPMAIKIDRQEAFDPMEELGIDSELSLLGKDFFKIKVSDDIPVVGGTELDMSAFTFPVGVTVEGDDVKISLGVDLFSRTGDKDGHKWKTFKDLVIQHAEDNTQDIEEFCKDYELAEGKSWKTTKKANKFDMNVLGYVEGRFVNGEFVVKEGQLNLGGKFMFQSTAHGALWVVPVYGSVEAGSDFSIGGKLTRFMPDEDFPFEFTALLNISPQVEGKAGVGVKDAASAGLYAEGKMPFMIAFQEEHLTLDLEGEIGVEAELFILHASKPLFEGTTNLIDWYYGTSAASVSLTDNSTTGISTEVVSRDYSSMTSEWLGAPRSAVSVNTIGSNAVAAEGVTFQDLQTSIFSNSQPQLVTLGSHMLLVWVEDDASRDTYNRMRLVFSVYDPVADSWSTPASVWDDGYNDGYPRVVAQGENAYVLWQKVKTTLTAENATSPDATLENSELCLAMFDTSVGAFVDAQIITNNNLYEYAHNMVIENGEPVIYWAVADENAMNESNANSLYRWEGGFAESIAENLNYVLSIDAAGGDVTYVADTDGNLSDTTDVTAFTISTSGTESFVNSELDAAVTYASYSTLADENTLFLSDMRNVYYEQNGILKTVLSESRIMGGNLNIVETDLGTTILWTETVEGWNELYAVTYRGGAWTEPVMLSERGELLSKISAVSYGGKLTGVCNANAVVYDDAAGEYVKGNTDLVLFQVNDFSDIALEGCLSINESELEPGTETQLKVIVYNNGTTDVNNITFEITDTLGTKSVQSVSIDIPSGCSETVDLTYCVPQNYATTILTVTAQIAGNDADASDNTISLEIGNQDLSVMETAVEILHGGYLLKAIVENSSLVDAENVVLSVFADKDGSELLQSVIIGTITRDNYALAEILLKEETLNYSENGAAKIYVKLTADGGESSAADNLICIVVAKAETTVCMHPVSDMVVGRDPTCSEAGHEKYEICAACNEVIGDIKELLPLGHDMGQWETINESTCTENGIKQRKCSRCDHAETEEIPANGHSYTATVTNPTCTEQGYTTYTCIRCGDSYVDNYTEPVDHVYVDGYCKWCGQGEQYVKWYSGTTSLNGTIDLNIYVILSEDLVNASDTYVRFTYAGKTVDVPMKDALHSPLDTAPNRYRFSCPIYAKQLADSVNVKFMKGSEMIGEELNYSVVTYCKNRIKKSTDPAEVAICKAMLNYGAASQQLFNYNTENLANASLSDADKVLADVDASAYKYSVTGSEDGIKAKSATLMLEDVVKVRVYFTLTGDKPIEDYTFTIDGKAVTPEYNEKGWYVETDGIAAKDLEKMFTVKVGGITVEYGALSYVNSKAGGSNELESNISKALYAYWQAAEALLG